MALRFVRKSVGAFVSASAVVLFWNATPALADCSSSSTSPADTHASAVGYDGGGGDQRKAYTSYFIAPCSGEIESVEVGIRRAYGEPTSGLKVSLWSSDGSNLPETLLSDEPILYPVNTTCGELFPVTFASPVPVVGGTHYNVVVWQVTGSGSVWYGACGNNSDVGSLNTSDVWSSYGSPGLGYTLTIVSAGSPGPPPASDASSFTVLVLSIILFVGIGVVAYWLSGGMN